MVRGRAYFKKTSTKMFISTSERYRHHGIGITNVFPLNQSTLVHD
jgi:hypothetical protein